MPLIKHKKFKYSVLCDVFVLIWLALLGSISRTIFIFGLETNANSTAKITTINNLTAESDFFYNITTIAVKTITTTTTTELPIILEDENPRNFKLSKRFDSYHDFSKIPYDTIHRILRDEDNVNKIQEQNFNSERHDRKSIAAKDEPHSRKRRRKRQTNAENIQPIPLNLTISENSTKLTLVNRNLTQLASLNLTGILHLNLTNNHISQITNEQFHNLNNLNSIDLTGNRISNFQLPLDNLQVLNLSCNKVSNFSTLSFKSSSYKLANLNLRCNNITSTNSIHLNLSKLNLLKVLDLSDNQIIELDHELLVKTKSLRSLNMAGNRLAFLRKESFSTLVNLETLILSNNNITKIDYETFLFLPNLQYLDLSENNIHPDSIRSLQGIPDLVGLSIAYNSDLGNSLQEFVASWSLKELDASGTGLCRIPAALAQSVRVLKLRDNWFTIIRCGDLDSYPLLQHLDLSFSSITDIEDDALGRLEILQTLFLDHNALKRVPISLPTSLENLFLHNNLIMDIQPGNFVQLINLKTLDLSCNKLIYMPGLPLPKLITFNLQSSELQGLSQSVVKTSPNLRDLMLEGNPIKCADLLGIAEWATPCRISDRIILLQQDEIHTANDIKERLQPEDNFFKDFNGKFSGVAHFNANGKCQKNNFNEERDMSALPRQRVKLNEIKKPKCASTKFLTKLNNTILQSNKLQNGLELLKENEDDKRKITTFNETVASPSSSIEIKTLFTTSRLLRTEEHLKDKQAVLPLLNGTIDIKTLTGDVSYETTTATTDAKTQILSSKLANNSTENITEDRGIWTTPALVLSDVGTIKSEHPNSQGLSGIKSDNNYVETGALLSQKVWTTTSIIPNESRHPKTIDDGGGADSVASQKFETMPKTVQYISFAAEETTNTEATMRPSNQLYRNGQILINQQQQQPGKNFIFGENKEETEQTKDLSTPAKISQSPLIVYSMERKEKLEDKHAITFSTDAVGENSLAITESHGNQYKDSLDETREQKVSLITTSEVAPSIRAPPNSMSFYHNQNRDTDTTSHKKDQFSETPDNGSISTSEKKSSITLNNSITSHFVTTSSSFPSATPLPALIKQRQQKLQQEKIQQSSPTTIVANTAPTTPQNLVMSPSKVNKADKVVFFDQLSSTKNTENGVIKQDEPSSSRNQSLSMFVTQQQQQQHQQSPQRQSSHKQQPPQQQQGSKKIYERREQHKSKMQKLPKQRNTLSGIQDTVEQAKVNQEKNLIETSMVTTKSNDASTTLVLTTAKSPMTTTTSKRTKNFTNFDAQRRAANKPGFDKHLKFTEEKKSNVTIVTFTKNIENQSSDFNMAENLKETQQKITNNENNYSERLLLNHLEEHPPSISISDDHLLLADEGKLENFHFTLNTPKDITNAETLNPLNERITKIAPEDLQFLENVSPSISHKGSASSSSSTTIPHHPPQTEQGFEETIVSNNHYKVNTELIADAASAAASLKYSQNAGSQNIAGTGLRSTSTVTSANGLPPEQWLDIRKATGHPGLFIVIGVTFGLLLTLGLIHIYRCRRPLSGWHHSHNHLHHLHHQELRSTFNNNRQCHARRQSLTTATTAFNDSPAATRRTLDSEDASYSCDNMTADECYTHVDYDVPSTLSSSVLRREFLPMELLSASSRHCLHENEHVCHTNANRKNVGHANLDKW